MTRSWEAEFLHFRKNLTCAQKDFRCANILIVEENIRKQSSSRKAIQKNTFIITHTSCPNEAIYIHIEGKNQAHY